MLGSRRAALPLLALALPLVLALSAPALAAPAPQWTQPGGGELNRLWSPDVAGPRVAPVEAWRVTDGEVLSEPVVSNGWVYVVVKDGKATRLLAYDAVTGERVLRTTAPAGTFAEVLVDGSNVLVATSTALQPYVLRNGKVKRGRRIKGTFVQGSALAGRIATSFDGKTIRLNDLQTGKVLIAMRSWWAKPIVTRPSTGSVQFIVPRQDDTRAFKVWALGEREVEFNNKLLRVGVNARVKHPGLLHAARINEEDDSEFLYWDGRREGDAASYALWQVPRALNRFTSTDTPVVVQDSFFLRKPDRSIAEVNTAPPGKMLVLRDKNGRPGTARFVEQDLVASNLVPEGSVDGPMSAAGDVLMLGNWAIDVGTDRVLWVAPELKPDGRLVPAGDGRVVFVEGGALVCAAEPDGSAGPADIAGAASPLTDPGRPGSASALVLRDGRRIEGEVTEAGDRFMVQSAEGGAPFVAQREDVSAVDGPDGLRVVTDGFGALVAYEDHLLMSFRADLGEVIESLARRRLVNEGWQVMDEYKTLPGSRDEVRRLEALLQAKRNREPGGTRDVQLASALKELRRAREEAHRRRLEGARWLADEELPVEASALLSGWRWDWGGQLDEEHTEAIEKEMEAWVPEAFPWLIKRELRWAQWSREIVAAQARFVPYRDLTRDLPKGTFWRRKCTALRTENITLLTTSEEADIVGACLRHGEGAIRVLERVLGPTADVQKDARRPLEVRLHKDRASYLRERLPEGFSPPFWSAGFYMPSAKVSRFYVPSADNERKAARVLYEVVAHELTHQYIAERWRPTEQGKGNTPATPGFFMIEGFARFIEDQTVELGRSAARLDNRTADSVETAAALHRAGALLPMDRLVDMPQTLFALLEDEAKVEVQLATSLGSRSLSERGIFYDQAGALVFFLMNEAGPAVRERFLEAMSQHYLGKTEREVWTALGYPSAGALERAFWAFLEELPGG